MNKTSLVILLLIVLVVSGCGGQSDAPQPTSTGSTTGATSTAASSDDGSAVPQPVMASSELVVGPERFVFALVDPKTQKPINDVPEVTIQFFKVHDNGTATKVGDATPIYRSKNLPAGLYVVRTTFTEAGQWGALMDIKREGKPPYQLQANFQVLTDSTVPMVGKAAPPSKNQTVKDVKDIGLIDSALPHDNMHGMTIAAAVASGKPTLILFAAPGYCPSFTCGPDMELVESLKAKYSSQANFIHIETPNTVQTHTHEDTPNAPLEAGHQGVAMPQVRTAADWGLETEPWLFLIDKDGKVFERFEGGLTLDEVEPEFMKLVQ